MSGTAPIPPSKDDLKDYVQIKQPQKPEELLEDDRIEDPIDQSMPSVQYANGYEIQGESSDIQFHETTKFTAILQGLLGNMSIDPLAVEKNTSLAVQYLDVMQRKLDERLSERQRKVEEEVRRQMEEAVKSNGLGPYFPPLRPPMKGFIHPLTGDPKQSLFMDVSDEGAAYVEEETQESGAAEEGEDGEPSSADGPDPAETF